MSWGTLLGVGLGLYTTKGLVEAQGGRTWVQSKVGEGSPFPFALPAARLTGCLLDTPRPPAYTLLRAWSRLMARDG